MKVSLNWVKQYTDADLPIGELVQKIGRQLGAVEEVIDLSKKYQGIVIAKVVTCEKHPNADKLQVCLIDDGGKTKEVDRSKDGLVQVVCGAPNVQAGQVVVWLPPGRTVPSTYDTDPFVLEARELRGVVSNGMLASPQELGIGDDHSGILTLEKGQPGTDFAEEYGLNDYIIDIENKMFTHRPDCFGILGVAREIAGITGQKFTSPKSYLGEKTTGAHPVDKDLLQVENKIPELVPRFMLQVIEDIKPAPSPLYVQIDLMKVGLKPINSIVDITNYFMYLTGQPMHAYDYDKLVERADGKTPKITIRLPQKDEKLTLLNGKTVDLLPKTILIADEAGPIGLGGVMGGADTEVDENTKNIVLECANFDMYTIRRASMEYGLFTDAVTRFNKGQSPFQTDRVMPMAVDEFIHQHGVLPSRSIYDLKGDLRPNPDVKVSVDFINSRLGLELTKDQIAKLLTNVEFSVDKEDPLVVKAPFWRTDIHMPEDIVEEVGRLYDYGRLPKALPERNIKPAKPDKNLQFKSELRQSLASLGANEVLTYSFVHGNLLQKVGQNKDLAFKITNALSPDLQYYRLSLTPSLLAHIHPNIKSGHDRFAIFEIGKAHNKLHKDDDNGVPKEYEILALTYADKKAKPGDAYYQVRNYLDELAANLGVTLEYQPIDKEADVPVVKPFDSSRAALVFAGGTTIGIVGEYKSKVRKQLKLPVGCAGFEIGIQELIKAQSNQNSYKPLSRFPSISQDVCLQVKQALSYGELTKHVKDLLDQSIGEHQSYTLEPVDIYQSEKIKDHKRITYRITLTDYDRTLTESVLTGILDGISAQLAKSLHAERI